MSAQNSESLQERLQALVGQLQDEDLDEAVHDAKSEEATKVNNGGVEEQVEYLRSVYGVTEMILLLNEVVNGAKR